MKGENLMSQDNNINSTSKQLLLDFIAAFPNKTKEINEFMELWSDNDYKEVDKKFANHQYPQDKITFNKQSLIEECPELQKLLLLSKDAFIIFEVMLTINKSPNNLVRVALKSKTKRIIDVCNLQYITGICIDNIRKAMKLLLAYDFIRVYKQHIGTNPTVYMINPKYCTACKANNLKWDELEKGSLEFDNLHNYRIQMIQFTEQKSGYDDNGNDTLYDTHYKASEIIVPNPDIESDFIKPDRHITSMTDTNQKEPKK